MIFLISLGPFRCAANPTSFPHFTPSTLMLPPISTAPLPIFKPTTERSLITSLFAPSYPLMAPFFVSHALIHLSKMVEPNVFFALLMRVFAHCSSTHTCLPDALATATLLLNIRPCKPDGTTPINTSYSDHLRHMMIFMFLVAFVILISPPQHHISSRLALSLVSFLATNQTQKASVATTRSPIV